MMNQRNPEWTLLSCEISEDIYPNPLLAENPYTRKRFQVNLFVCIHSNLTSQRACNSQTNRCMSQRNPGLVVEVSSLQLFAPQPSSINQGLRLAPHLHVIMAGFMTGLFELRTAEIQNDKVNNVPRVSITNTNGFGRDSENFGQSGSFQLRVASCF